MKYALPKWAGDPHAELLDLVVDQWSDPFDVPLTEIKTGHQRRIEDVECIGSDIRKAAFVVLPECDARHG